MFVCMSVCLSVCLLQESYFTDDAAEDAEVLLLVRQLLEVLKSVSRNVHVVINAYSCLPLCVCHVTNPQKLDADYSLTS